MFRIDTEMGAPRAEPYLPTPARPQQRQWGGWTQPLDREGSDPQPRLRRPLPGPTSVPEREPPIASREPNPRIGPVASLVLHLLPLLLLLDWPMRPPAEVTPIPVQLVFEPPPPPPPPRPPPKPKPEVRPPPGRIASVDMGDVHAQGSAAQRSSEPKPGREATTTQEPALEAPEQTAMLPPPPALPDPPKLDLPKPPEPKPLSSPKTKPAFAARRPLSRIPERANLVPRTAKYPGPAATRDEYLAYLAYLARQHIGLLTRSLIAGRRGETIINVLVLDDGTIAMLSVGVSSGYPDIDERIEQMIRACGRFPPLPQWYQAPAMRLEFRLQFPEELEG